MAPCAPLMDVTWSEVSCSAGRGTVLEIHLLDMLIINPITLSRPSVPLLQALLEPLLRELSFLLVQPYVKAPSHLELTVKPFLLYSSFHCVLLLVYKSCEFTRRGRTMLLDYVNERDRTDFRVALQLC